MHQSRSHPLHWVLQQVTSGEVDRHSLAGPLRRNHRTMCHQSMSVRCHTLHRLDYCLCIDRCILNLHSLQHRHRSIHHHPRKDFYTRKSCYRHRLYCSRNNRHHNHHHRNHLHHNLRRRRSYHLECHCSHSNHHKKHRMKHRYHTTRHRMILPRIHRSLHHTGRLGYIAEKGMLLHIQGSRYCRWNRYHTAD